MNSPTATAHVSDPVCGMTIDPTKAVGSSSHGGTTYHFCSRGCEAAFDADPSRYTSAIPASKVASCCETGHSCS